MPRTPIVVCSAVMTVALAAVSLTACGSSGTSKPDRSATTERATLAVYAAASLTGAFTTLKTQFQKAHPGTTVALNFGASSDLAQQITQGADADVFASASPKNMQQVVAAGDAANSVDFATNTAEIAVPPRNPAKITSVQDLAKKGVKIALCAPAVPCGKVAAQVFANAKVTVTPSASEKDVKSTLAVVESGEVDAGVVYVTDVKAAGSKVTGIAIPDDLNASTAYPIAALKKSTHADLARAWVTLVRSSAGQQVLTAAGFQRA